MGGDLHPFVQRIMWKELLNEQCKHDLNKESVTQGGLLKDMTCD